MREKRSKRKALNPNDQVAHQAHLKRRRETRAKGAQYNKKRREDAMEQRQEDPEAHQAHLKLRRENHAKRKADGPVDPAAHEAHLKRRRDNDAKRKADGPDDPAAHERRLAVRRQQYKQRRIVAREEEANLTVAEYRERRRADLTKLNSFRQHTIDDFDESKLRTHDVGMMDVECPDCKAFRWDGETHSMCCFQGKVVLHKVKPPPLLLRELFNRTHPNSAFFHKNIRLINSSLAFVHLQANQDHIPGHGPPTFRIQGVVYHVHRGLLPDTGDKPAFLQLYIHDTDNELQNRLDAIQQTSDDWMQMLAALQNLMHRCNPLAKKFKSAISNVAKGDDFKLVLRASGTLNQRRKVYNIPAASEVAVIIPMTQFDSDVRLIRDITLTRRSGRLERISAVNKFYDPLHYVLFFPFGDCSWDLQMKRDKITLRRYYAYRYAKSSALYLARFHP